MYRCIKFNYSSFSKKLIILKKDNIICMVYAFEFGYDEPNKLYLSFPFT